VARTKKADTAGAPDTAPASTAKTTRTRAAKAPEDPREAVAKALSKELGFKHELEDIKNLRTEASGAQVAVTPFGNKARVQPNGDVEILVGPGMPAEEVAEPAAPPATDEAKDLPPLAKVE